MLDRNQLWDRYNHYLCKCPGLGISVDISRMNFDKAYLAQMEQPTQAALQAMRTLESGQIANPDENRMVGHYWLRAPELAPSQDIAGSIKHVMAEVTDFAAAVHDQQIKPPHANKFTDLLIIGIGGSALGPQLVADCLGTKRDKLRVHFLDNTDPDGIERILKQIGAKLKSTLVVVISKSGGTPETRNGMLETQTAFASKNLVFANQAVAITGEGSKLDQTAEQTNWLKRFPMWDWVGGRTSVTSAVGLVPAALQGIDTTALLSGAAAMDRLNRSNKTSSNPAVLLALMWYHATGGRGEKDMVILPYKDRLILLSRYLQQLVMESLGKEKDLDGLIVHQGIAVYGNKGSTDQHAYVQQLRDGLHNFFVNFIVVLRESFKATHKQRIEVEPQVTTGDYLNGFWLGTREALYENDRESLTITMDKLDAKSLGALIALYERAVSLYAHLVNINAYHQPGVEAGKKAAAGVLDIQRKVIDLLSSYINHALTVQEIADELGIPDRIETIHHIVEHLVANKRYVKRCGKKYQQL